MQIDDDQWTCPSFNSYSLNKSSEIAVKVTGEDDGDQNLPSIAENHDPNLNHEDDDFEFALIINDELEISPQQTIPIFPIFNRDLVRDLELENPKEEAETNTIKVPLRRLFIEDQEAPSSSSSDSDDVESIPPGSYCVWKPKAASKSPSTCKKSKSTGFGSARWKLKDLLKRSNSEGKDSFVFLTPKRKEDKKTSSSGGGGLSKAAKSLLSNKKSVSKTPLGSGPGSGSGSGLASPGGRMIYSPANRAIVGGNGEMQKRKTYLPYRQDLVGFFTTVNSIGRNFSPL